MREERDKDNRPLLVPSGSGVLVNIGDIRGVVTAAHVIHKFKQRGPNTKVAIFTIVRKDMRSRRLEFLIGDCDTVAIGGETEDPGGPDLGFVRLPHKVEQRLIDDNLFFNFDVRLAKALAKEQDDTQFNGTAIVGVVGEKSELKISDRTRRIDTHTMDHAYCEIENHRNGNEGLDIFDVLILHNDEVTRPLSYGGLSGAGLWAVNQNVPGAMGRSLFGIAFHETDADGGGNRRIICHGPNCIYRDLAQSVAKHYPDFKQSN